MLLEKLYKKVRKIMKRVNHNMFGPSRSEILYLSRSNRKFIKEQNLKKSEALRKLIIECSKIKPQSYHKKSKSCDNFINRAYDKSGSSDNRDDSGAQAYQTDQLF